MCRTARIRSRLATAKSISRDGPARGHARRPLPLRRAGRQSRSRRRGDDRRRQGARRALPATRSASSDEEVETSAPGRSRTCRRPTRTAKPSSPSSSTSCPATTRPLEAQITVRMAESGGRAVERKLTLPIAPAAPMIGVKPLFSGRSLGDGDNADFRRGRRRARRQARSRASGLRYELLQGRDALSVVPPRRPVGITSRSRRTERVADGTHRCRRRQAGAHLAAGEVGPLSPRSVERRPRAVPSTSIDIRRRLLCGSQRRHAGPAGDRARQAGIRGRRDA